MDGLTATSRVLRLAGYTYPATYKVCMGSARGGRPNPYTGLQETGSPPLPGCARLAWFPDGYRIEASPYRSALRPNPASRAHRPRNSAFPTAVGDWLSKGRAQERPTTCPASKFSAFSGRKPRATLSLAPASLAAPAKVTMPYAGVTARPPGKAVSRFLPPVEKTGSRTGGEGRLGAIQPWKVLGLHLGCGSRVRQPKGSSGIEG